MSSSTDPRNRPVATIAAPAEFAAVDDLAPTAAWTRVPGPVEQLIEQLRAEALEAGYRDGFARGVAEGRTRGAAEAAAEVRAQAAGALAALDTAAHALRGRDAVVLAELDTAVVDLAIEIARSIVQRDVAAAADPGRDALVRAVGFVPERGEVLARLNPADIDALGPVDDLLPGRTVRVVPDARIASGDAVLEVGACRIDAQIDPALERAREALR